MIEATNTSVKRELIPAGNYVARCYSMIHIGTITELILGEQKRLNKVRITWELPTELRVFKEEKGEQPMVISQEFTLSMNEKSNLRKFFESWRGKGFTEEQAKSFDISKLIGQACMLNIIHKQSKKGSEFEVISSVSALPKGLTCPDQINESFEWNYGDCFDLIAFEAFPEFLRDKIKGSEEYRKFLNPQETETTDGSDLEPVSEERAGDDLPF